MADKTESSPKTAWVLFGDREPRGPGPFLFKAPFDGAVRIGGRRPGGWGIGWAWGEDPPAFAPGVFKERDQLAREGWLWTEMPE